MKNKILRTLFLGVAASMMLMACKTTETTTEVEKEQEQEPETATPIDLAGFYDENDLEIVLETEVIGGVETETPSIKGLKDKALQDKINADMKRRVEALRQDNPGYEWQYCSEMGNFANVISIFVNIGGDEKYDRGCLNYDLRTGEIIEFEDFFLQGTDTHSIVREGFRETIVRDSWEADYDEALQYKLVKDFLTTEEKTFSFSPSTLFLYCNGYVATISLESIADDVAIYSRYLTEDSIFEQDGIGKENLITCTVMDDIEQLTWEYGMEGENVWFDFMVHNYTFLEDQEAKEQEKFLAFDKKITGEVRAEMEQVMQQAKENPDKFYILLYKTGISIEGIYETVGDHEVYTLTDIAEITYRTVILEMPRETYESVYKEKIREAYRYDFLLMAGGVNFEVTEPEVLVTEKEDSKRCKYLEY